MNLTTRRIIFFLFFLLFLIISPLIVLYASGYQIDFNHLFTPLGVQKTGMTIIHSEPPGADIFLNDKEVGRSSNVFLKQFLSANKKAVKTPANIKDLPVGSYNLRVELPGYWPWQRKIEIFPGKITHVLDINLFKKISPQFLSSLKSQPIFLSPNNKKIFLPAAGELFDLKTQNFEKIPAALNTSSTAISWSDDSSRLAIGKNLLNLKNPNKNSDLNKIIGSGIGNLKWDGGMDKAYYQYKNSISVFDTVSQTNLALVTEKNILDYEVIDNNLYYIIQDETNSILKFYSLNDKKITKQLILPSSDGYRLINSGTKLLNLYDKKYETLYLIDTTVSNDSPILETIDSVKKTQWVSDQELIWANDYEIWALDLEKNENRLITRWSLPIANIIKTKAANYILYTTEKTINVITWNIGDEIQVTELASFDSVTSPVYDDDEKNLYFMAKNGNDEGLYRFNIQ